MTKRTDERMQALGCILCDGLSYSWFRVVELDDEAVTATVRVDTGEYDEDGDSIYETKNVTADDVARGLRMYREWLEGKREMYPGEWGWKAKDAVREGRISDVADFDPVKDREATGVRESYAWQTVIYDRTNGAEGDYDANTADNVMQFALIGHAIYG